MRAGNVFQQAIANLRRIKRDGWLFTLNACGASAVIDLASWAADEKLGSLWIAPTAATALIWMAAVYVCAAGIIRRRATRTGYLRFALASTALALPLLLVLTVLIATKANLSVDGRVVLLLIGVMTTFALESLLVAWPIGLSVSSSYVSPFRVFKATRGYRWLLIFLAFAATSIDRAKIIPDMSIAVTPFQAFVVAIGRAATEMFTIAFGAAIAAAAWEFATDNDPSLDPS